MASRLGMSVAPVLEAMLMLEAEGLLLTIPRKGTQVRVQKQADIDGQLLIREALECQAVRFYWGQPIRDAYPSLLELAQAVDQGQDKEMVWEAEVTFHCALIDLMGNPAFSEVFRRAMRLDMYYKLRLLPLQMPRNHVAYLNRLAEAQSEDAAMDIVRQELWHNRSREEVKQRINQQGNAS